MRIAISRRPIQVFLRLSQRLLFIAAIFMLSYAGVTLAGGWWFQHEEGRRLDQLLMARGPISSPGVPDAGLRGKASRGQEPAGVRNQVVRAPFAGGEGLIGRITIQRLGVSVVVAEGVDGQTLGRAVGHIPGTALPGQTGNVVLSAHRDTYFRPLRKIQHDDIITVSTLTGEYSYRVISTKVVPPTDVSVLSPGLGQSLTLITCYPFYFVGFAPNRFIVHAERIA
jgi:sortase A